MFHPGELDQESCKRLNQLWDRVFGSAATVSGAGDIAVTQGPEGISIVPTRGPTYSFFEVTDTDAPNAVFEASQIVPDGTGSWVIPDFPIQLSYDQQQGHADPDGTLPGVGDYVMCVLDPVTGQWVPVYGTGTGTNGWFVAELTGTPTGAGDSWKKKELSGTSWVDEGTTGSSNAYEINGTATPAGRRVLMRASPTSAGKYEYMTTGTSGAVTIEQTGCDVLVKQDGVTVGTIDIESCVLGLCDSIEVVTDVACIDDTITPTFETVYYVACPPPPPPPPAP